MDRINGNSLKSTTAVSDHNDSFYLLFEGNNMTVSLSVWHIYHAFPICNMVLSSSFNLASPYLFTGFFLNAFPIEQVSPFSLGADEFEEDTLIASQAPSQRIGGFERNAGSVSWGIFHSLKIVLLKSKLNVLIPCGFLAIIVNYLTGNHVCVLNFVLGELHPFVASSLFALCCIVVLHYYCFVSFEGLGISSDPAGHYPFGRKIGFLH
jgi:hypothetical protein